MRFILKGLETHPHTYRSTFTWVARTDAPMLSSAKAEQNTNTQSVATYLTANIYKIGTLAVQCVHDMNLLQFLSGEPYKAEDRETKVKYQRKKISNYLTLHSNCYYRIAAIYSKHYSCVGKINIKLDIWIQVTFCSVALISAMQSLPFSSGSLHLERMNTFTQARKKDPPVIQMSHGYFILFFFLPLSIPLLTYLFGYCVQWNAKEQRF